MNDKVQKIREKVEKLKSQFIRGACSSQVAMETRCKEEAYNEVLAILDSMQEEPVGLEEVDLMIHKRERIEVMIITTISGLEATYKHFKNKYPVGTHGSVVYSSIPAVKHMVETYLIELNKEIQIENLKEEIKNL